jgi:hypothetical protein
MLYERRILENHDLSQAHGQACLLSLSILDSTEEAVMKATATEERNGKSILSP